MSEYTILFADVAGSTALYDSLGDQQAETIISQVLKHLSAIVDEREGKVIKTIGDELMCQFGSAEQALLAASRMHEAVTFALSPESGQNLAIRIGAHAGSVIDTGADVFGDTVNVSARIAALARPGKTMISEEVYQALPIELKQACRFITETFVKGKDSAIRLYDAVWEQTDELTRLAPSPRTHSSKAVLIVEFGNQRKRLDQGSMRIGRANECDLRVMAPQASRFHCEIRQIGSKCTLTDGSTNGTYVLQNSVELFFHNETVPLHQSGIISLGQRTKDNPDYLIHFFIENENT